MARGNRNWRREIWLNYSSHALFVILFGMIFAKRSRPVAWTTRPSTLRSWIQSAPLDNQESTFQLSHRRAAARWSRAIFWPFDGRSVRDPTDTSADQRLWLLSALSLHSYYVYTTHQSNYFWSEAIHAVEPEAARIVSQLMFASWAPGERHLD